MSNQGILPLIVEEDAMFDEMQRVFSVLGVKTFIKNQNNCHKKDGTNVACKTSSKVVEEIRNQAAYFIKHLCEHIPHVIGVRTIVTVPGLIMSIKRNNYRYLYTQYPWKQELRQDANAGPLPPRSFPKRTPLMRLVRFFLQSHTIIPGSNIRQDAKNVIQRLVLRFMRHRCAEASLRQQVRVASINPKHTLTPADFWQFRANTINPIMNNHDIILSEDFQWQHLQPVWETIGSNMYPYLQEGDQGSVQRLIMKIANSVNIPANLVPIVRNVRPQICVDIFNVLDRVLFGGGFKELLNREKVEIAFVVTPAAYGRVSNTSSNFSPEATFPVAADFPPMEGWGQGRRRRAAIAYATITNQLEEELNGITTIEISREEYSNAFYDRYNNRPKMDGVDLPLLENSRTINYRLVLVLIIVHEMMHALVEIKNRSFITTGDNGHNLVWYDIMNKLVGSRLFWKSDKVVNDGLHDRQGDITVQNNIYGRFPRAPAGTWPIEGQHSFEGYSVAARKGFAAAP